MRIQDLILKRQKLYEFLEKEEIEIGFNVFSGEIIVYGKHDTEAQVEINLWDEGEPFK